MSMIWILFFACNGSSEKETLDSAAEQDSAQPDSAQQDSAEQDSAEQDSAEQDDGDCVEDIEFFRDQAASFLEGNCYGCHNAQGVASSTRHVLIPFDSEENIQSNFEHLQSLVSDVENGAELLLEKPTGQASHGGGTVV